MTFSEKPHHEKLETVGFTDYDARHVVEERAPPRDVMRVRRDSNNVEPEDPLVDFDGRVEWTLFTRASHSARRLD